MKTRALIKKLSNLYPKHLSESYDHVGLMVGPLKSEVQRVLLALDYDETVYEEARKQNVEMVITHHPFLFGKRNFILKNNPEKSSLYKKSQEAGLMVYAFHTNFDNAINGMNDFLSKKLGLVNVTNYPLYPGLRIGDLRETMEREDFVKMALKKLEVPYGLLLDYGTKKIQKVGIVGGAGSFYWKEAKELGADIFISGDVPHHARRDMVNAGVNYLDIPHEVERIFIESFKEILLKIDQKLTIFTLDHEREPRVIIS